MKPKRLTRQPIKKQQAKKTLGTLWACVIQQAKRAVDTVNAALTKKIKGQDIALFSRQLATLISAGIPLAEALDFLLNSSPPKPLTSLIEALKKHILEGGSLSMALRQFPTHFDALYNGLIEIGELSGTLGLMLNHNALRQEKMCALQNKIKNLLLYPCIVFVFGLIIAGYLMMVVVPTFKELFEGFKVELPLITRLLLAASTFIQETWALCLVVFIACGMLLRRFYQKNVRFKRGLQQLGLKLPLLGTVIQSSILAAFSRAFATTQTAGIPVDRALQVIALILPQGVYGTAVKNIQHQVSSGITIHEAMLKTNKTNIFPSQMIQMIALGETTGKLDFLLQRLTETYETSFDLGLSGLTTLIEPIMISMLGIGVGSLVLALYLPIFNMGSVF